MKNKISLKDVMEAIRYKISDGAKYCWKCYGNDTYMLDSYNKKGAINVVFDVRNQCVYELSACDYIKNTAYKWINPKFIEKHSREMKFRKLQEDQAWDSVNYEPVNVEKILTFTKKIARRK